MTTKWASVLLIALALAAGFLGGLAVPRQPQVSAARLTAPAAAPRAANEGLTTYERGFLMTQCYRTSEGGAVLSCLARIEKLP